MRNKFADIFYNLGKNDSKLHLVVADISPAGSISRFREEFPNRFINTGVAEQVMIGMVAGMCQRGLRPFAYTIATFSLFRPYEFVRNDLCYQNLPVTIVGIGGGVTYSTLGGTHHAMEDISIASSIPNMNIIAPCDPNETAEATKWCAKQKKGPVYLRLGKAGEPNLSQSADENWKFGKIRTIRKTSGKIAVITYGAIASIAQQVTDNLELSGKNPSLFFCSTIKPLDKEKIITLLKNYKKILVIEETVPSGSLGEKIQVLAYQIGSRSKIFSFTLKDKFIHFYGNHTQLLQKHGLDVKNIINKINIK